MMSERILVTSALPYANGALHFGHIAGAYLPGDCYARFERLQGHDVLYICGSDEHGVAITLSAELAKRSPQEHVDHFHTVNKRLFQTLSFSFDYYGRTTSDVHAEMTKSFYDALQEKGMIEPRTEQHLYSELEKRFLADRYVVGTCPKCAFEEARGDECQKCGASYEAIDLLHPKSKLTGSPLEKRPSEHLYLRFDRFKERLKEWIEQKQWKENVVRFAMSYIDELRPRAITRDSKWGIDVPGYPDKVFYVWFDAPIGYISISKEWDPKRWQEFWLSEDTKLVHFIGKDNIPFHTVFFPAMLMGQKLPYKLPDEVPANEFFLLEGRQFSKSEGWTIDLDEFFTKYTPDQARYAIAANAPETSDSEFSWKDFQMRCNAELLGKLGNLVRRVMVFAHQHCEGRVPHAKYLDAGDDAFLQQIQVITERARDAYTRFHLRKATQLLMELAQLGNAYFEHKKPWALAKSPEFKNTLDSTINCCIQCVKQLALVASPIIPTSAQKIWEQIGFTTPLERGNWDHICKQEVPSKQKLQDPIILFRKIEDAEIDEQIAKLGASKALHKEIVVKEESSLIEKPLEALKETISFDQFAALDLRVGKVLQAEKVAKSKKLLKLQVDLGFETRTILSGISQHYEPEQLIGRRVTVVVNLAPVKIMGIESQGMILAAHNEANLELPTLETLPPGTVIS